MAARTWSWKRKMNVRVKGGLEDGDAGRILIWIPPRMSGCQHPFPQRPKRSKSQLTGWVLVSAALWAMCVLSRVWLCDPMDCSPPGSSIHWILQARTLEWVAISSSRGSSWPKDWNCVSGVSCIAGGFFTCWAMGEAAGHTLGWDIISPQKRSLKRSTCIPVADSFWCLAKLIQCFKFKKKKKKRQWHKVTII